MIEILLDIGFIEEMRTTWGDEEVTLTFLSLSAKTDLIRLTAYTIGNPWFQSVMTPEKDEFVKFLAEF